MARPASATACILPTELFAKKAGIKLQHVPYKGASEVMTAMLGGSVQMMFVTPPSVMGLIKDGRVRPLAFTGTKPFPPTPDVPLMKDLLPGYGPQGSWGMFFAPGKTPDAIVDRLNADDPRGAAGPGGDPRSCSATAIFPDDRDAAADRRVLPQGGPAGGGGREEPPASSRTDRAFLRIGAGPSGPVFLGVLADGQGPPLRSRAWR